MPEREEINNTYPDFAGWDDFPNAPGDCEDAGPQVLVEFINLVDQNAEQNAFHTASTLNNAFRSFKEPRP